MLPPVLSRHHKGVSKKSRTHAHLDKLPPRYRRDVKADLDRIADRIQKRRQDLDLTQEEAAEKLDIAPTTLQYIEQRRKYPSLPMLLYICRVFGIDFTLR